MNTQWRVNFQARLKIGGIMSDQVVSKVFNNYEDADKFANEGCAYALEGDNAMSFFRRHQLSVKCTGAIGLTEAYLFYLESFEQTVTTKIAWKTEERICQELALRDILQSYEDIHLERVSEYRDSLRN